MDSAHVAPQQDGLRRVDRSRRAADRARVPEAAGLRRLSTEALVRGIHAAVHGTCANLGQTAKRSPGDVRRQLAPVVRWLVARLDGTAERGSSEPPIVSQEYVDRLRSHLVRELAGCEQLDGRDVVRVMSLLEELSEAWKGTDRGKFMSCLTGSESSSAIVAIAHDMRSPLSSILILVESLRRGPHSADRSIKERQLGLIYGAAQGLATLAADLIDAARGEEHLDTEPRPFSIVEAMHAVEAIVQPIAEEKGLELYIEHPAGIEARIGHAAPLQRVLLNLTSNALRYTETGSVTVRCRDLSPTRLEFSVEDTGGGLPPIVQQTLFDAFRPEPIALRFSSAGLGLATVRALLCAMGTSLRVETSPERGTKLSFDLELKPSPR